MRRRPPEEPLTPEAARQKAMRLLGRREHSAKELSGKLRLRGMQAEQANAVVENLAENGWQSDDRFAESRLQSRIGQGFGPLRIKAELRVAGLAEDRIREVIEAAECDWEALCATTLQRKFGHRPKDASERRKQFNSLSARGFTGDQIRHAMILVQAEVIDDPEATSSGLDDAV